MELYKEILSHALSKEEVIVIFPNLSHVANEIVALKSYEALQKIKAIIEDNSLDDCECFK